jgi:hypothetical protein
MTALKKLRLWLQARIWPTASGPAKDTQQGTEPPDTQVATSGQKRFLADTERYFRSAEHEARSQRNWRYRSGPWQQK